MKKPLSHQDDYSRLRRKAEGRLQESQQNNPEFSSSPEEMHRIIHELSVHQIELEMQQEELLQSREELEKSLERYTELYDFAPLGYLTLARDGTILEVNLTGTKILGVERSLLKGDRFGLFVLDEDIPLFNALLDRLFSSREAGSCEVRLRGDEARQSHTESHGAVKEQQTLHLEAVLSDDGQECRAVVSDITRQKKIEKENALLQATLAQSQKLESIGRLAGGVAHDYNNMLQVMLGNIELLNDEDDLGSGARTMLDNLRNSVLKSAALTRQLLAFARKQLITPKIIDFNAAVSEMLTMLRSLIGENIQLIYTPGSALWPVKMDSSQIDQIMANLAINARDAIRGAGTMSIRTCNVSADALYCQQYPEMIPGDYVLLIVEDNGCGMDTETLELVFEPFYTTKSMAEHSGLGLATVHGIVRQNNGFIKVSSKKGEGTTFEIYLPRSVVSAGEHCPTKESEVFPGGSETILLVEDEDTVREVAEGFLKSFGYRVLVAESPDEALSLFKKHSSSIGLLITDILLPQMSGRELAERVRRMQPGLKCLLISGYSGDFFDHPEGSDVALPFLGKPFTRMELAVKVREVLDRPLPAESKDE